MSKLNKYLIWPCLIMPSYTVIRALSAILYYCSQQSCKMANIGRRCGLNTHGLTIFLLKQSIALDHLSFHLLKLRQR